MVEVFIMSRQKLSKIVIFHDIKKHSHELNAQEALRPGHAPGDRVHPRAAQDALGQDHAPGAARPGMGRGDRRHLHPGERLNPGWPVFLIPIAV